MDGQSVAQWPASIASKEELAAQAGEGVGGFVFFLNKIDENFTLVAKIYSLLEKSF